MSCICKNCGCADVCEFYDLAVKPVIELLAENDFDKSDLYIQQLNFAIEGFDCDQFESK